MDSPPVDKSPERIRRMFDAVAPRYDLTNRLLSFGIDPSWRRFAARRLLHEQTIEGDILDVCCGTGDLSLAFATQQQRIKTERMNYGIDFSPEMIEIAQRKAQRYSSLRLSVGDALDLPFEDNRFALVAVAFGLRNVHDTQRGLVEMVRVCKPGGTIAVLDFSMPTLPVLRHIYQFYFCVLLPRLGNLIAKDHYQGYTYLMESVMQFDRPAQLVERLTQLGVVDVCMQPMTFGIVTLTWGVKK
jgi:demethylmenaquinone methyltransferase/2-methoxy-6-polyprenyl-1,4-benzoquinol methylase